MSDVAERALKEVVVRHQSFVDWFRGDGKDALFADIERSFAPGFRMFAPCGTMMKRDLIVEALKAERAARVATFDIIVDAPEVVWSNDTSALVTYIERQSGGGEETARRSTALFTRDDGAPCGVVWQHVQETWITNEGDGT